MQLDFFWHFVLNTVALNGRSIRFWEKIARDLIRKGYDFLEWRTTHKENAIEITKSILERGGKQILVIGGDITLNEVINGITLKPE